MKIQPYQPELRREWDEFVKASKNGTFLLLRAYMDYHSERFKDCSLTVRDDRDRLMALLPASAHGEEVRSHGGLTYGGLVMGYDFTAVAATEVMDGICRHYAGQGFKTLLYKPIPHIYHKYPAEEDLYALFRQGGQVKVRNLATVISMTDPIKSSRLGKRAAKRMKASGIRVREVKDVSLFWEIITTDRRERHNTTPVHTLEEMSRLHSLLPEYIKLYVAENDTEILAGAVIFDTGEVLHLQYAAATAKGKLLYAVDAIYHEVVLNLRADAKWFDFGTSNERDGLYLNSGMVAHKEEFGGRSVVYDTYTIRLQ